jgi:hypothetical protein
MMIHGAISSGLMDPVRFDGVRSTSPSYREDASAASTENHVFSAVDVALDLTPGPRDLLGVIQGLDETGLSQFGTLLAHLLQQGIVGIETLDDHGRPYRSFITTRIAAPHLRDARYYREQPTTLPRLNTRI